MCIVRLFNFPLLCILAVISLVLAAFSPLATADEMKFKLSGDKEVPPVVTKAFGQGIITVNKDMTISGKVTTSGITPSMAHIHHGKAGSNGPAIIPLDQVGDNAWVVPNDSKLNEDEYRAYLAGDLYVNVHTAEHQGGEIRGQLLPGKAVMKTDN
jgi:hypothetical protein